MKKRVLLYGTKKYGPIAIAALLVLLVSVVLWYFPKEYAYRLQPSRDENLNPVDGAWDLTPFDLEGEIIFIEGTVEYVLDELLTPEEFDAYEGEIHYGRVPDDAKVATARLRLIFPKDKLYAVASGSVEYNERVYINGLWHHDVGQPGLTADESVAAQNFNYFDVLPQNGMVEIVRQGSNFVHKEGGGFTGYWVGSYANIKQMAEVSQTFTAINIGLYLCLFILHMVLFLLIRGYRPNLWFALLCLAWLARAGFTGRFIGWAMFPDIPWTLMYKLGCISIAFTGVLLMLLARDQFPGAVQKWPQRIFTALQIGLAAFYAVADTVTDSRVKVASEMLLGMAAVYLVARLAQWLPKNMRQKKLQMEQVITLAGLAVALFALLHDAMRYNNWLPGIFYYEIGEAGMLMLVLFQMAAMTLGTMRQLTMARQNTQIAFASAEVARKSEMLAKLEAENLRKDMELRERILTGIPEENLVTCGALVLDTTAQRAYCREEELNLAPKEFALLVYLIAHKGEDINRQLLYEAVWGQQLLQNDKTLRNHLSKLRNKIEHSGYHIASIHGYGYRLEEAD